MQQNTIRYITSTVFFFFLNLIGLQAQIDSSTAIKSEEPQKKPLKERLRYNINGGASFGTVINVVIAPQIGYQVTEKLVAGVGLNLAYYKDQRYSTYVYGGNLFTRYMITKNLFAQIEDQLLNYSLGAGYREYGNYVLAGAGWVNNYMFISAFYIISYPSNYNIYGSPYVYRVGFLF